MNDVLESLAENMHGYLFAPFWLCGTAMNTSPNHVKLVLYVQSKPLFLIVLTHTFLCSKLCSNLKPLDLAQVLTIYNFYFYKNRELE